MLQNNGAVCYLHMIGVMCEKTLVMYEELRYIFIFMMMYNEAVHCQDFNYFFVV